MKRLLAAGADKIFQFSRCFRQDEAGRIHNPEFTMLEWYATDLPFSDLLSETDALLTSILHTLPAEIIPYSRLFTDAIGVPAQAVNWQVTDTVCREHNIIPPDSFGPDTPPDELQQFLMGFIIEPQLGKTRPVMVTDFPLSQAALARPNPDGTTAARFEAYYQGIELCNGYDEMTSFELTDQRLDDLNDRRRQAGRVPYPKDPYFLDALKCGLPSCVGNALGVDRLVMLALGFDSIAEVTAFTTFNC